MALAFELSGTSLVTWGGADLGVTEDGPEVTINHQYEDVMLDSFGSRVPGDVQCMLADARIDLSLVYFDPVVLADFLRVGGAAPGTMPAAGTLMGSSGALQSLSTGGSAGYTFPKCMPVAGGPIKKGTRVTRARVSARAIPFDASKLATSASGAVLFI